MRFKFSALPKSLALLGYLIVHRRAAIGRDTLAFTLWPDDPEASAIGKLRRHLHDLQKALPPDAEHSPWLVVERDSVQWNTASAATLDVDDFERLGRDDATKSLAVDLYRGDLLEGIYDDWLFPERERLRGKYLHCLVDLVRMHGSERDFERAIEFAERLLSVEPWREDMLRELLILRYESGDRAGALHMYADFVKRLRADMSADPMPETRALYDAIMANARVTVSPTMPRLRPNVKQAPVLPLVGRAAQMEVLKAAWKRAARGNGTTLVLAGEAGIGKSRVADELAGIARMQGGRVLIGFTTIPEPRPYAPFMDALEGGAAYVTPETLAALRAPEESGDERDQTRWLERFSKALREMARTRPVLVVLEDVHWCGAATLVLLEFVARRIAQSAVLIVATAREEELHAAHPLRAVRNDLVKDGVASQLQLARLDLAAVQELVRLVPAQHADGARTADRLLERTDGHPLYLAELLRDPMEQDVADIGFGSLIEDRWSRVDETAFTLAEIAAVAGDVFDLDLLSDATGWRYDRVMNGTRQLLDHFLVQDSGQAGAGISYAFTHNLVRTKIYDQIPERRAAQRHAALALVLERRPGSAETPAIVAHHFDRAHLPEDAARWLVKAAAQARALFAFDDALRYARRGLELAAEATTRAELLRIAEVVYGVRGERQQQRAAIDELEILEADLDDDARRETLLRRIRMHRAAGELDAEADAIDTLTASIHDASPALQACALLELGLHAQLRSNYDEAVDALREAEQRFSILNDQPSRVIALCALAEVAPLQNRFADASAALEEAQRIADRTADSELIARTLRAAVASLMWRQEFSAAGELADRALKMARLTNDLTGQANALERLASVAVRQKKFGEARDHFDEALRMYRELESPHGVAVVLLNRGVFLSFISHFTEAEQSIADARQRFRTLKESRGEFVAVLDLGMVYYYTNRFAEAKASAEEALTLARQAGSVSFEAMALTNLGAAERELGSLRPAIEHMLAGIRNHDEMARPLDLIGDLTDLLAAYVRAGDGDAALRTAERIETLLAQAPDEPRFYHYVLFMLSMAYRETAPETARAFLERAYAAYVALSDAHPDDDSRAAFAAIAFNRDLLDAWRHDKWPGRTADASALG